MFLLFQSKLRELAVEREFGAKFSLSHIEGRSNTL